MVLGFGFKGCGFKVREPLGWRKVGKKYVTYFLLK